MEVYNIVRMYGEHGITACMCKIRHGKPTDVINKAQTCVECLYSLTALVLVQFKLLILSSVYCSHSDIIIVTVIVIIDLHFKFWIF